MRNGEWIKSLTSFNLRPARPHKGGLRRRLLHWALLAALLGWTQGCQVWNEFFPVAEYQPVFEPPHSATTVASTAPVSELAPVMPLAPLSTPSPTPQPTATPAVASDKVARPGNPMTFGETGKMGVGREFDAVYFNGQSAELDPVAKARLDGYAEWLRTHPQVWVTLAGHTDRHNTEEFDYNLGMARALAVADYLAGHGLDPHRFFCITYGKDRLASPGKDPEADALNNRVEVLGFVAPMGQDAPTPVQSAAEAPPEEARPERPSGQELPK